MSRLHLLDFLIIGTYVLVTLSLGLAFRRRASRSQEEYFLSGRSLPWWVLGTSMVATTFAADTPLAVTGFIRDHGIWYNWFGWHYVFAQMMAVVFFSRFWRRARVLTDNELIELRYSGKPAAFLRGFKAGYFAILYNFIVLGWVLKGLGTVAEAVLGVDQHTAVIVGAALALSYALLAGFWGVVVTDVVQFVLAMTGSISVAVLAVRHVGGLAELKARLMAALPPGDNTLALVPGGGWGWDSDFVQFLIFVTVMWWASHNADGGGYLIQRMSAAKNEKHARGATLWFVLANNAVRYWPWIMTGLASLVIFPVMPEGLTAEAAYPLVMLEVLGPGLLGLLLVSFFAAFMSTIDTHLNWGASYLINDIYRRFLRPDAGEKETVLAAKLCVLSMMVCAVLVAFLLTSIGKAWLFVWAMGAGIGPVLVLRWFWWRLNAWSEIAALASSVVMAFGFEVVALIQAGGDYALFATPVRMGSLVLGNHHKALILVPVTVISWLVVTFLTRPVEAMRLEEFYRRVRPGGWWGPVARALPEVPRDDFGWWRFLVWAGGCAAVLGTLFGIGKLLMGEPVAALGLFLLAAGGAVVMGRELLQD
ncbi:sodium:proline symporter [bacterium DOLJORAL78_65_58]|nr:MAG: sodium:proline symporter [bacterium DOLZORAL124_64_63]PIE76449.1 MAG: sodium:proline symporter [bacterium DOLJORAL78_65_58]